MRLVLRIVTAHWWVESGTRVSWDWCLPTGRHRWALGSAVAGNLLLQVV